MSWLDNLKKKLDPTALGAGIGSTIAATITYFTDMPLPVAAALVLAVGYFVGHISPNKENNDHGVDLTGGDS